MPLDRRHRSHSVWILDDSSFLANSAPVFAVSQQLLHVHFFFLQTSKEGLELG